MGRADAPAVDDQHTGIDSVLDRQRIDRCAELCDREAAAQRDCEEHLPYGRTHTDDALPEEVIDEFGHGQVVADLGRSALAQESPELECEEWIPACRLVDATEDAPWHDQIEPLGKQRARRTKAERAHLDVLTGVAKGALQLRGLRRPPREQEANPLSLEAASGERQRLERGDIEPGD